MSVANTNPSGVARFWAHRRDVPRQMTADLLLAADTIDAQAARIAALEAENARLREAMRLIAAGSVPGVDFDPTNPVSVDDTLSAIEQFAHNAALEAGNG